MKAGRFVVDTHVHAQRFAAGKGISQRPPEASGGSQWGTLGKTMSGLEPYDNTPRLEYDMDCYGVDMCVLLPAFGMTDELNLEIVERCADFGIPAHDVVVDPLVMPIGALGELVSKLKILTKLVEA